MHTRFLLPHFILFVAACRASLLKLVLLAIVHKQFFPSFVVSQSEPIQFLLLSAVSFRLRRCTFYLYICLPRTRSPNVSAVVTARQIPRVADAWHFSNCTWNHQHRFSLSRAVRNSLAQLKCSPPKRFRGDLHVLLFIPFRQLQLPSESFVRQRLVA